MQSSGVSPFAKSSMHASSAVTWRSSSAVKMMRKIAGRSQADYARLVGVSPRVLIELERGIGNPTVKTLQKLLAPFDLELTVRRSRGPVEPR